MTLDQKQLVQKTWEKVLPISDSAATLFYGHLFELDPSSRSLFAHTNMPDQRRKLMNAIGMAVNGLDTLDLLIPAVRSLGRRHVSYGVTHEHYSSVGNALIWTLEQGLGQAFIGYLPTRRKMQRRNQRPKEGRRWLAERPTKVLGVSGKRSSPRLITAEERGRMTLPSCPRRQRDSLAPFAGHRRSRSTSTLTTSK